MLEVRSGDSSHIFKALCISPELKTTFQFNPYCYFFFVLIKSKRGQEDTAINSAHVSAVYAFSVIEALHPEIKSGPWMWQLVRESQAHVHSES